MTLGTKDLLEEHLISFLQSDQNLLIFSFSGMDQTTKMAKQQPSDGNASEEATWIASFAQR